MKLAEIRESVMKAYADCHGNLPFEQTMNVRDLHFRADAAITRDNAIDIMGAAITTGYNEFSASVLAQLPESALVTLARENSVCVYVNGKLGQSFADKMKADELDYNPNTKETRIWWD